MCTSIAARLITLVLTASAFTAPAALRAQSLEQSTDPCLFAQKSTASFYINQGNFQPVVKATSDTHVVVCELVFTGSASLGFNISIAGVPADANGVFTVLGILYPINNAVVVAGNGGATQFITPKDDNFSLELGGSTPLMASGWVSYILVPNRNR